MRLFHAPARGATPAGRCCKDGTGNFNPRPPRGGRRYVSYGPRPRHRFQSTPPARGATVKMKVRRWSMSISIHAPREGGDSRMYTLSAASKISIHAPREGGDGGINYPPPYKEDFNPRPPRGGRPGGLVTGMPPRPTFQSTPPARGATTASALAVFDVLIISIHAPREGGDGGGDVPIIHKGNFNPRPPRGGRRIPAADLSACRPFQSTPPARGATLLEVNKMVKIRIISIHAPREGGDSVKCRSSASSSNNFNPRPPRGGRRNDHLSC